MADSRQKENTVYSMDEAFASPEEMKYPVLDRNSCLLGGIRPTLIEHGVDTFISLPSTAMSSTRSPVEDISPSCSTDENQLVFDNQHSLMDIVDDSLDDCNVESYLSFMKEPNSSLDLQGTVNNHDRECDLLESWKRCLAEEWEAQGDTILRDVFLDGGLSLGSYPQRIGPDEYGADFFWANTADCGSTARIDRSGPEAGAGNANSNMSTGMPTPRSSRFILRRKGKCRSAPELWRPEKREDVPRSLSHYDLSFSSSLRPDGHKPLYFGSEEDKETVPPLLWGEDAYNHYKLLTLIELKEKLQLIQSAKTTIIKKYMWKQRVLQNIVDVAKAYYSKPSKKNLEKWKAQQKEVQQSERHSMTDLQHSLAQIPYRRPYFTFFLMMAHVFCLTIMCIVGNLGPAGMLSEKEVAREVQTFLGAETIHRYNIPNPWIGPPVTILLASGASLALCLRHDRQVEEQGRLRKYRALDDTFGCCEMRGSLNAAGTTTKEECTNYTNNAGVWSPPLCSQRSPGQNNTAHVIRPCCVDHKGSCQMLSQQHCTFLGGTFHQNSDHCVQVLCVRDVCTIGKNLSLVNPDLNTPWLPDKNTVWQWWRLLLALIYTYGIVHCLALLAVEWLLMRPLETSTGWLYVMLIYASCGAAGQIVACTVQPYIPHVGSTSGIVGLIGEAAVELSHAWPLLDTPRKEVVKLASFALVLLTLGLLPYVSLLGSVAGCACGALCALIFMPHFTYKKWGYLRKVLLMTAGAVGLLVFYIIILYAFVKLQPPPCQGCRRLECISFADNMCNQWDLLG